MTTISNYIETSNIIGNIYQRNKDIYIKIGNIVSIVSESPGGMQNTTSNIILKNYNISEDKASRDVSNPNELISLTKKLNESAMNSFRYSSIDNFLTDEDIKVTVNYAEISNIIGGIHHISESNIRDNIVYPKYLLAYNGIESRDLAGIQATLDYAVYQGCNSYSHLVGGASLNPLNRFPMDQEYNESTDTWPFIELLLQECEKRNIDLWLTFYDPRYFRANWGGSGADGWLGLYGTKMLFKKWFRSLAKLAVLNPRLKGVVWDDIGEYKFFQDTDIYTWNDVDSVPILTVDYCKELYEGIKEENTAFRLMWVCYEPYDYWTHDIWAERMPYTDGLVYAIYRYISDDPVHGNPVPYPLWADMTPNFLKKIYNEQKETIINNLLLPWQDFWYVLYATGTTGGGDMNDENLTAQLEECMIDLDFSSIYYFTTIRDPVMYTGICPIGHSGLECRKGLIVKSAFEETEYIPPFLYDRCNDSLDSLLVGKNPSTSMKIYSTQINPPTTGPGYDTIPGTFIRNTDCWINSLKGITSMSPFHTGFSYAGGHRACTLISPRHFIACSHSMVNVNFYLRFVDRNNNVYIRRVIDVLGGAYIKPPYPDPCVYARDNVNGDIMIGLLDSDLPPSIEYVPVFPANVEDYLPVTPYKLATVCMIGGNTTDAHPDRKATVRNTSYIYRLYNGAITSCTTGPYYFVYGEYPAGNSLRIPFYSNVVSGDSGEPLFLIVNDQLVLISHHYVPDSGPSYHNVIDEINSHMETLSIDNGAPVYQLTEADISGCDFHESFDNIEWVYQNTPITTMDRHKIILNIDMDGIPLPAGNYNVNVRKINNSKFFTGTEGDVIIHPTSNPLVWDIIGSRRGVGNFGYVTLEIDVNGDLEFSYEKVIEVRQLGNAYYDFTINSYDRSAINEYIANPPPPNLFYLGKEISLKNADLNGDGIVDGTDIYIINEILNGHIIP